MLIQYLIFCLGAGFLQVSYVKQPNFGQGGHAVLDAPLWFSSTAAQIIVPVLALGAFVAEVALGFVFVAWWAGVFFWIPVLLVASVVIPSKNPASSFFLGILIVIGSSISFLL